jgi:hypothetical protein
VAKFDMTAALALVDGGSNSTSAIEEQNVVQIREPIQLDPSHYIECITDGCTQTFDPANGIKRCSGCRKHSTRFVRPCKVKDCEDFAYTSQLQVTAGKSKYGDNFQPFSRCFAHSKAHHDSSAASEVSEQEFVIEDECATEGCENPLQMTAKELAFYESKNLDMPTRCSECRAARSAAKKDAVECECEACGETFNMPVALKTSLEDKGKQLTCYACRSTTTRNCNYCHNDFLTKAQVAWNKAMYAAEGKEWRAPNHCSKECKTQAQSEMTSEVGRTRNNTRK